MEGLDTSITSPETDVDEPVRRTPGSSKADAALVDDDVAAEYRGELLVVAADHGHTPMVA